MRRGRQIGGDIPDIYGRIVTLGDGCNKYLKPVVIVPRYDFTRGKPSPFRKIRGACTRRFKPLQHRSDSRLQLRIGKQ